MLFLMNLMKLYIILNYYHPSRQLKGETLDYTNICNRTANGTVIGQCVGAMTLPLTNKLAHLASTEFLSIFAPFYRRFILLFFCWRVSFLMAHVYWFKGLDESCGFTPQKVCKPLSDDVFCAHSESLILGIESCWNWWGGWGFGCPVSPAPRPPGTTTEHFNLLRIGRLASR